MWRTGVIQGVENPWVHILEVIFIRFSNWIFFLNSDLQITSYKSQMLEVAVLRTPGLFSEWLELLKSSQEQPSHYWRTFMSPGSPGEPTISSWTEPSPTQPVYTLPSGRWYRSVNSWTTCLRNSFHPQTIRLVSNAQILLLQPAHPANTTYSVQWGAGLKSLQSLLSLQSSTHNHTAFTEPCNITHFCTIHFLIMTSCT